MSSPSAQTAAAASGLPPPVVPVTDVAAPHSPDVGLSQLPFPNGGPSTPNSKPPAEDRAPQRKWRMTQTLRNMLWTLYNIHEEIHDLTNEYLRFEGKKEEAALKWRKVLYADVSAARRLAPLAPASTFC